MSLTPDQVETTFFLTVEPKFGMVWRGNKRQHGVEKITVKSVTQSRPAKPNGVVVKLTIRFNEAAFLPLQPQAVIEIPDAFTSIAQAVEVEAEDENGVKVAEYLASQARGASGANP